MIGPSAKDAIVHDLKQLQHDRRRHFVPALLIVGIALVLFVMLRARSDLWQQPLVELGAQLGLWVLALIVYPAIGLGLLFPSQSVKVGLILVGAAVVAMVSRGWSMGPDGSWPSPTLTWDPCSTTVFAGGALVLVLAFFSGAFLQRHRAGAMLWLGVSMALAAFGLVTWACPAQRVGHILPSHAASALVVLLIGTAAGLLVQRFERHRD